MDLKQYILSGQLEAYALNLLLPEEREEVEKMISQYPELKSELVEIEMALNAYRQLAQPLTPSLGLKTKVLDSINDPEVKVIPIAKKNDDARFYAWVAAACAALLIVSLYFNYNIYKQLIDTRIELANLNYDKTVLAKNHQTLQVKFEGLQHDIATLKIPGTKIIELPGMPEIAPGAKAMVYYNNKSKEVYAEIVNLPTPPEGMEYQLWALADGVPIDGGVMGDGQDTLSIHKMKSVTKADMFAITLEPKGGKPSPTGNIYCCSHLDKES